jgi:translation initiation factor 2B subunit (eIF-2B alpha/beta/delta family)
MKRFLLLALLLCAGCSDRSAPSFATVMKLHDGQTYDQVVEIMGKPDYIGMGHAESKVTVKLEWAWNIQQPELEDGHAPASDYTPHDYVRVGLADGLVNYIDIMGVAPPKGK